MKVSFLCVTHERAPFMPWLLWNYERQKWPDKELVIVDSSPTPFTTKQKDVRIIHAPGAYVPAQRNLALAEALGDVVTWLDDDDWRHPDSIRVLEPLLAGGVDIAGGRVSWFVNLFTEETQRYIDRRGVLFANVLIRTEMAREIAFDETVAKGGDVVWMEELLKRPFAFSYEAPSLFLCHDRNMGNTAAVHQFNRGLDDPREIIGAKAWGKTEEQLKQLRERLGN